MRGRGMGRYIGRRLLMVIPIAFAITLAVFLLASLIPGGAVAALLNGRPTSDQNIANLKAKYGLDQPLVTQYWEWLKGVFHGNLGRSFRTSELVSDSIKDRFALTVMLNSFALILAVAIGVPARHVGRHAARPHERPHRRRHDRLRQQRAELRRRPAVPVGLRPEAGAVPVVRRRERLVRRSRCTTSPCRRW